MFVSDYIIIFSIVLALGFNIYLIKHILYFPSGTKEMIEIADTIKFCAKTYLKQQYKIIFFVSIFISLLIFIFLGFYYTVGFVMGAFFSGITGYIGMLVSVNSNVRTANAAKTYSLQKALDIAFRSGNITGVFVITFGIFCIYFFYKILFFLNLDNKIIFNSLISLALGASLISVFARLGGGIFTKSADIGADLVGKLEIGIPEDDPRNPAVIADNVGDNVGDCAGMAADLFETYCVSLIASMVLFNILFDKSVITDLIYYPLVVGSFCIFATIISVFFVKLNKNNNIMFALYKGFFISFIVSIVLITVFIKYKLGFNSQFSSSIGIITGYDFLYCSIIGFMLTFMIIIITEYYTSVNYNPVKSIAEASTKGHAPNIICGLSVSMEATTLPVICVIISIILSYSFAGIIGISISVISMVSLSGIIVTLDAYGPITDNAGGIAQMANLEESVRIKTDALDSVGNTTKAVTKGYAIASAGLASLVLFITYTEDLKFYYPELDFIFSLKDPYVISGLLYGGIIPYLFSSFSMRSVGIVANKVVEEIRVQFKENDSIKLGLIKPNYKKVIELLTKESIKEMIIPALLPIILPFFLYSITYFYSGILNAFVILGSMLLGTIIVGIFLAISMTSGGGAWDNAKKYIENGNFGGKGSEAHKASITGDMVGDPYKDTSGPAINPLIKVTNIIALLIIICSSNV
jgi:K(+)-stimulated pyrophosphate-energized sodium pump